MAFSRHGVAVGDRFVFAGEVTFTGADWSPFDVTVGLEVADEAPHVRVSRLDVRARAGGQPVTVAGLAKSAHLGQAIHRATAALSYVITGTTDASSAVRPSMLPLALAGFVGHRVVPSANEAELLRRGRASTASGPTDAELRHVATLYRRAVRKGSRAPAKAVWEALGDEGQYVARATVRTWLARARERGYLGADE